MLSIALVVATGVNADGDREVLGCDVGLSEEAAFWTASLRDLKARGLTGVQLVISDAHTGLQQAIRTVLQGASWQRCRVHFLRNCLAHIPKSAQALTATLVRNLRPSGPLRSPGAAHHGRRHIGGALPAGGSSLTGRRGGHPGLHGLSPGDTAVDDYFSETAFTPHTRT